MFRLNRHRLTVIDCLLTSLRRSSTCRIGCSSGFWGDTSVAATQLATRGNIDFLVSDYLSEITMSLLAAMKAKFPESGFVPDFVQAGIGPCMGEIKKKGIRVVTNAGGLNVDACAEAVRKVATAVNWSDIRIATVYGDDILKQGHNCSVDGKALQSRNVYLGASGIKSALDHGADVVITGRCVDSALTLGPLMHTFQWDQHDYDKLASGSLAGHLVECGAQVTGGIFTDHSSVPDWWNIGFPIVECEKEGKEFIVSKPDGTGGLVNRGTVCEQLLYEIHDPRNYLLPDVNCDFSQVHVEQISDNLVRVSGARGQPLPQPLYKATGTYLDGFRLTTGAIVIGPDAGGKARRTAEEILRRVNMIFKVLKLKGFRRTHIQIIGAEESYGSSSRIHAKNAPREVCLWLAAEHEDKRALDILAREIAPAGTGMAPGLTGLVGAGRPKVSPIFRLHTEFIPMKDVEIKVNINGKEVARIPIMNPSSQPEQHSQASNNVEEKGIGRGAHTYRLGDLCWLRSGDKANICNIGVISRNERVWPIIQSRLTTDKVANYFQHLFPEGNGQSRVHRYPLPGIQALNFVLEDSLGGGGVSSLRPDPQGKAFGQMLADLELDELPEGLIDQK